MSGQPVRRYLTVQEVADRWGLSKMTIYRMLEKEELSYIRVRRSFRILESSVLKYEKEHAS